MPAVEMTKATAASKGTAAVAGEHQMVPIPLSHFRSLADAVVADDYDSEFLRPSEAAFHFAWDTLAGLELRRPSDLPPVSVAPAGDGGLMAQWGTAQRYVRLLVPADPARAYLYSKEDGQGRVEDAAPETLRRRLEWL